MPKIQNLILKLEGFQYYNILDLNMVCYRIITTKNKIKLCTIILPCVKYNYKWLHMEV